MARVELRPFGDDDAAAAGRLLAERQRRHRAVEPLLPARYEDAAAAQAAVDACRRREGAFGAVALAGGAIVGYLVAAPVDDASWGANAWVELAGHAVAEPEHVRDLYAAVAERFVHAGRTRHYVLVPAADRDALEAWSRLGFGQQQAHAIREVEPAPWPASVREAEPRDLDALGELAQLISRHHAGPPVFSDGAARRVHRAAEEREAVRAQLEADVATEEVATLVAEAEGRPVGFFEVTPVELAGDGPEAHGTLARPDGACFLAFAATLPESRGSGAGLALTQAALAWAYERGYASMVTDWRVTNLLASRFWPRRGFRPTFLRLYRSIP